jgi:hypothetical protein
LHAAFVGDGSSCSPGRTENFLRISHSKFPSLDNAQASEAKRVDVIA